jgi:hypothetical protein
MEQRQSLVPARMRRDTQAFWLESCEVHAWQKTQRERRSDWSMLGPT